MWWFKRGPKLGTPENPEIIQPGERPRSHLSRLPIIFGLLRWAILISLPAVMADSVCLWLLNLGKTPGGELAWIFLALFALPAILLTLIAGAIVFFLLFTVLLTLLGKPVYISKFGNY